MNQKIRKLQNQILTREVMRANLVKSQQKAREEFDAETKKLETRLDNTIASENVSSKAVDAWCRVTNALIRKYKPMAEEDPQKAYKQLTRIEGALLAGGFITEEELRKAL